MNIEDFVAGLISGIIACAAITVPSIFITESWSRHGVYKEAIHRGYATFDENGQFQWVVKPEQE
jgi:hypothetical protein